MKIVIKKCPFICAHNLLNVRKYIKMKKYRPNPPNTVRFIKFLNLKLKTVLLFSICYTFTASL